MICVRILTYSLARDPTKVPTSIIVIHKLPLNFRDNAGTMSFADPIRQNEVPLVRRSAAMRFLSEQKTEAAQSRFGLQSLGYHCTAEHVAHAVVLALNGAATSK